MYVCVYIYIYIYIERERERDTCIYVYMWTCCSSRGDLSWSVRVCASDEEFTPSPPTKSLGFRGFDSSRLLIIRGGNSHVR